MNDTPERPNDPGAQAGPERTEDDSSTQHPDPPPAPHPPPGPMPPPPGYPARDPGWPDPARQRYHPAYPGPPAPGMASYLAAPQPGVVPLRPLGLGEILDGAISTIRRHPVIMMSVSAVVVAVIQLITIPLVLPRLDDLNRMATDPPLTLEDTFATLGASVQVSLVAALVAMVGRVPLTGLLASVVGKAVLGEQARFSDVWPTVRRSVLPLLGLAGVFLLGFVALFLPSYLLLQVSLPLGMLLGLVGFVALVLLSVLFSLSAPALALEDAGVVQALRRSVALVRPNYGRVFGITVLTGLIVFMLTMLIQLPFEFLAGGFDDILVGEMTEITVGYLLLSGLGTVLASTITEPFAASVTALIYTDQRMRREGLDIELARYAGGTGR